MRWERAHGKDAGLYPNRTGKPLEVFKQGTDRQDLYLMITHDALERDREEVETNMGDKQSEKKRESENTPLCVDWEATQQRLRAWALNQTAQLGVLALVSWLCHLCYVLEQIT